MTMSFIESSDDVFAFAGAALTVSGFSRVSESKAAGSHPVIMGLSWSGGEAAGPAVEVAYNPISTTRRAAGDLVDITLTITPTAPIPPSGAYITLQIPFSAEAIGDGQFGLIGALSMRHDRSDVLTGGHLGFADHGGFVHTMHMPVTPLAHGALGWRFLNRPADPSLMLRLYVQPFEGPFTLRIGRAFVGLDYDPMRFNPHIEKQQAMGVRHDRGREVEAAAEFIRLAEEAMRHHDYRGAQAFTRPFFVHRAGPPDFSMLIGNPNSIAWYAMNTQHGAGFYVTEGYARPGDVVLDCGAHAGEIAMIFVKAGGDQGRVFAFDPFPQNYIQVECQAILNGASRLISTRAGVGRAETTVMTPLELQQTDGGTKGFDARTLFPLKIEALDQYAREKPTMIKIDVEGAEVEALHGAQRLLREARPRLFIEVHPLFQKQFGSTVKEMFDLIPQDIYKVEYNVEGAPLGWNAHAPGAEAYFEDKVGGYVRATPL